MKTKKTKEIIEMTKSEGKKGIKSIVFIQLRDRFQ